MTGYLRAMDPDGALEQAPVVLHFSASTWRFRLASYLRGLGRPLPLLFLIGLGVAPGALVWAAMPDAGGALLTFAFMIGAGAVLLVVVLSGVATVVQRVLPSTITFTESCIQQEIGGVVTEHGWDWVLDFLEEADAVEIHVQPPPMRTGRLARPEPQRLVVAKEGIDGSTIAQLLAYLEANARRRS